METNIPGRAGSQQEIIKAIDINRLSTDKISIDTGVVYDSAICKKQQQD